MDPTLYRMRPFTDGDYGHVARISSVVMPEFPESADDARRWNELVLREPGRIMRKFIVEEVGSGEAVAWGGLTHTLFNFHPDRYFVQTIVLPAHRQRGIGRALYEQLEKEARERGAERLWAYAREDEPASVEFMDRRGFAHLRKTWDSRLTLSELDLSALPDRTQPLAAAGIVLTTLAEEGADRPDVRRRFHQLGEVSSRDVPRMGEYQPVSYEEFVQINIAGPHALPDAIFLARHGDEYVGWSTLQKLEGLPDTLDIGFTGTRPEYRGRGIASELKRRAVLYARNHGYQYIVTGNDSLNPRIWAINEKLGFRRYLARVHGEKTLSR